jgi:hypothetical protein
LHEPTPDELIVEPDYFELRDGAKAALDAYRKESVRWGQVPRIPVDIRSPLLRCDICMHPRAEALYVSWRSVLYCEKHMRKYWRDRHVNWQARALRERLYEEQREFTKHQHDILN